MAQVAARTADQDTLDRLRALVDRMDELVGDTATYEEHDRLFHDTIMQASGNRIARGVVRSLERQVLNSAGYLGRSGRDMCKASNQGHRRICDRIAARTRPVRRKPCSPTSPTHGSCAGARAGIQVV